MMNKKQPLLLQWISGWIELVIAFPIILIAGMLVLNSGGFSNGQRLLWLAALPLYSLLGILVRNVARISMNALQLLAAVILAGAAAIAIFGVKLAAVVPLAAGAYLIYRGTSYADRRWSKVFVPRHYWLGLAFYFVGFFVVKFTFSLQPYTMLLTVAGLLCLGLALFMTNSHMLHDASFADGEEPAVPGSVVRHNRLYVGLSLVAIAVIVLFTAGPLGDALYRGIRALFQWLFSSSGGESAQIEPLPEQQPMQLPAEQGEPALWAEILQTIFYILGSIVVLALFSLLLYFAYRRAGGALRKLLHALTGFLRKRRVTTETTGYVDEETNLFKWEQVGEGFRNRLARMFGKRDKAARWENMTSNRERARYLYRRFVQQQIDGGYPLQAGLTPRETERDIGVWTAQRQPSKKGEAAPAQDGEAIARLYDRARYGTADVHDEEVSRLRGTDRNKH